MDLIEIAKQKTIELLENLLIEAEIEVEIKDGDGEIDYLWINIKGEGAADLIGYHGRVLDAVQNILSLMLRKELEEDNARLIIEVNGYREKRGEYIRSLAERAIMQVRESKQSLELVPMKAFERRIVHMVAKEEEGISSESIGVGKERKVIIKYDN